MYCRMAPLSPLNVAFLIAAQLFGPLGIVAQTSSASGQASPQTAVATPLLKLDQPIERQINGGETQVFQINVTSGYYARAEVEQKNIDLVVSLFSPDGKLIVEMDGKDNNLWREAVSCIAEKDGAFRVEIKAYGAAGQSGSYKVWLAEMRPSASSDRKRLEAEAHLSAGIKFYSQGPAKRPEASREYEAAIPLWRELGDAEWEAITLVNLGWSYHSHPNADLPLAAHTRAIELFQKTKDRVGEWKAVKWLGVIHYNRFHQKDKAAKYFEQTLTLQTETKAPRSEIGQTLYDLGLSYTSPGQHEKARDHFEQALVIRREIKDRKGEAATLIAFGDLAYTSPGDKQKALHYYNEALSIQRAMSDRNSEATTLTTIGWRYYSLGEKQKALHYHNEALSIQRAAGDRSAEAFTLNNIGLAYNSLGENQKALDFFNQELPLRRAIGERSGEAATLHNIGGVYNSLGEKQKALDYLNQALPLRRAVGDRRGEASTLDSIGGVYYSLGERQKALDYLNQALPLQRAVADRSGEIRTLNSISAVYNSLGEKQKALDVLNQALQLQRAARDPSGEASTLNNIGDVYHSFGEEQKSLDYLNQALQLRRAVGDRSGEADTLNSLGEVYGSLGEKQKELDYYNQALPLTRAVGDRRGEAATLSNLGSVYSSLGDKQKAFDYYNQALRRRNFSGIVDRSEEAPLRVNIGLNYRLLGELHKALNQFKVALALSRAVGRRSVEARTLNYIGDVYYSLGERQKALDYYNQALQIFRAVGDGLWEARTLTSLGATYNSLGEAQKGVDYYNQALPIFRGVGDRSWEAKTLLNLGMIYKSLGDRQKALDYLNQALQVFRSAGDHSWEASTLANIALVARDRGNLLEARSRIEEALKVVESLRSKIASQELRSSYFATVQKYYESYIDVLMRLHKQNGSEGYDGMALEASERGRARTLLELLMEASAEIRQGVDPKLAERERFLQQQLNDKTERQIRLLNGKHTKEEAAAAAKEIEASKIEYQQVEGEIRTTSPRYAALTQPQTLSGEQIQKLLDKDTLLLEYSLGTNRSYLWMVTQSSITSHELPKRVDVEAAAKQFYEILTGSNQQSPTVKESRQLVRVTTPTQDRRMKEAATSLGQMLLGPVASQLGKKRLVIVADGALQYIPFGALTVSVGGGQLAVSGGSAPGSEPSPEPYQPLIFEHEIVSLPSASTLAVIRRETEGRKPAEKLLAVIADPVFDKDDERVTPASSATVKRADEQDGAPSLSRELVYDPTRKAAAEAGVAETGFRIPRLPGTRQEAERIFKLAPPNSRMKIVDFKANRSAATSPELGQYRYVHFATHGFLNSANPELSGLVLSMVDQQGQPQNGFLLTNEIFNLQLPAELVVLSACQTGLGKEIKGEGLVGLTRGFMYAGAPRVIVSLWSVDDVATSEMMARLYKGILQQHLPPAAALRAAQIEMWKDKRWQAPYYWAAFGLQGEWR